MSSETSTRTYDLRNLLAAVQLPALPQSALKIMELARDPENGPAEFAVAIEVDPGLTGQVLRFVNSSYFGFSREVSSVKLAITLVGVRTIKNFVLWSAVFSLIPNPRCGSLDLKLLWQDSLRRGLFARNLAKRLGRKEAEEVFSAALLQDLAIPLLAKELPIEYTHLLAERAEGKCRLSELEREHFGWTHAEAGALVTRQWKLPDEFSQLIEKHTSIPRSGDGRSDPCVTAVGLSALLPSVVDGAWSERAELERAVAGLALEPAATLAELFEQTDAEFAEFAPLLQLSSKAKTLLEFDQEAVAGVA